MGLLCCAFHPMLLLGGTREKNRFVTDMAS